MKTREQYERVWARHPPGQPAADPRGPHHRANVRRPEFERLCLLAARRRVDVGLQTSRTLISRAPEEHHRQLIAIALCSGGNEIASEHVRGSLDGAAGLLMPVLGVGA